MDGRRLRRIMVRAAVSGCLVATVGCASPPATTAGGAVSDGAVSRSPALARALAAVIDEAARDHASRYGRVPELSGRGDEIDRLIAELTLRYPHLLDASADEESRLRAGRIDYSKRRNEMRAIQRRVEQENIGLPIVSNYMLEQYRQGQLVGIRLELAARLLGAQLDDPYYTSPGAGRA